MPLPSNIGSDPLLLLDCRHNLGESILWDEVRNRLVWVNIHEREVWSWLFGSTETPSCHRLAERTGAVALTSGEDVIVALESSFVRLNLDTGDTHPVAEIARPAQSVRLNDGRTDPAGRFVCGGMDEAEPRQPISAVYSLDETGTVSTLIEAVRLTNSLCWSGDGGTLYFTDMPTGRIDAFDYDVDTGKASNRRVFADLARESGHADGSTVDAEDHLWNAQWGGGKLVRYAPDGTVEREVQLPVTNPSCVTFGGPDLDILFVTSAWHDLSEGEHAREPLAGSIFALRPGVRGRLEHRFAG